MGGYGSGGCNKSHGTVERFRRLDSFRFYDCLMGDRYLCYKTDAKYPHTTGDIIYHVQDKTAEIRTGDCYCDLKLSRVPGIDGKSVRMYFHCPYCGKRVRYLYRKNDRYMCRHCAKINYRIQQVNGLDKMRLKMERLVEKDLQYTFWRSEHPNATIDSLCYVPKPRYMRWAKYEALIKRFRELQDDYNAELWARSFSMLSKSVQEEILRDAGYIR